MSGRADDPCATAAAARSARPTSPSSDGPGDVSCPCTPHALEQGLRCAVKSPHGPHQIGRVAGTGRPLRVVGGRLGPPKAVDRKRGTAVAEEGPLMRQRQ